MKLAQIEKHPHFIGWQYRRMACGCYALDGLFHQTKRENRRSFIQYAYPPYSIATHGSKCLMKRA